MFSFGGEKAKIFIQGMTCSNCTKKVESRIKDLDGVKKVKIDLAEGSANVTYNKDKIELKKIEETIEGLGYKVV